MAAIYVTDQGAKIGIRHERLQVRKQDEVLAEFPLGHAERVVIMGNVEITTPAIKRLMNREIDIVFMSLGGHYYGRFSGKSTPHIALRRAQYQRQEDDAFVMAFAQRVVAGKIHNAKVLLQRRRREGHTGLDDAIADLDAYEARAFRTQTLNSLRGVEGSAAARYFSGYRSLLNVEWEFTHRNRRPPRDPINVLLSLGYTLLTRAAENAICAVGLDPYVGYLHRDVYNRPSMALDLVEEFRVIVDGLVLYVCNKGLVTLDDFNFYEAQDLPVEMDREAVKRFITAYEKRMRRESRHPRTGENIALWRFMEVQAREVARCLRDDTPEYRPAAFR